MSGIINKAKDAINKTMHPDQHTDTTTTGSHGTTGAHSTTGTHGTPGHNTTGTHGTPGHNTTGTGIGGSHNTTSGPHSSNLANQGDPRVDSDRDGSHLGQGAAGSTMGGSGMHGGATDPHTRTTGGPHNSDLMNKGDPRVDSDRDGSHLGQGAGYGHSTGTSGGLGHSGPGHNTTGGLGHSTGTGHNTGGLGSGTTQHGSSNTGPHNSNLLNKGDPRVDSDRDGSHLGQGAGYASTGTAGGLGHSTGMGHQGNTGMGHQGATGLGQHQGSTGLGHDQGLGHNQGMGHNQGSTGLGHNQGSTGLGHNQGSTGLGHNTGSGAFGSTVGPHETDTANKLDPRVDSDHSGGQPGSGFGSSGHSGTGIGGAGHNTGHNTTGTGIGGAGHNTGHNTAGTGLGHSTGTGHSTTGTGHSTAGTGHAGHGATPGPASNTAGPHKSDALNKLDPRVDSDLDGGKTYGGNKTYTSSSGELDASKHTPSDFRAQGAGVEGETDHQRRHSVVQGDARNMSKADGSHGVSHDPKGSLGGSTGI